MMAPVSDLPSSLAVDHLFITLQKMHFKVIPLSSFCQARHYTRTEMFSIVCLCFMSNIEVNLYLDKCNTVYLYAVLLFLETLVLLF